MTRLFHLAFTFHNVISLVQNYFELKSSSPFQDYENAKQEFIPMSLLNNESVCAIPVKDNKSGEILQALVSQEDYEWLSKISPPWYVSSSGYVVSSKRVDHKYTRKYMHREIHGSSASHINGNLLDNRRENLISTKSRGKNSKTNSKRAPDLSTEELKIQSIIEHECTSDEMPKDGKFITVKYKNSDSVYSGEIHNYLPHGFGTLYEQNKTTIGWWMNGNYTTGLIMEHKRFPPRMCVAAQIPPVRRAFIWNKNSILVKDDLDYLCSRS